MHGGRRHASCSALPAKAFMRATDSLRDEHQVIEHVLGGLEEIASRLESGSPVAVLLLEAALDFFAAFVDRCHEAKEQEELFPRLAARVPGDAAVDGMGSEHREGRVRLDGLRVATRSGGKASPSHLARVLREYVAFLRAHFAREDGVIFVLAERALPEEAAREMEEGFARVDAREMGPEARAALLELGEALARASRHDPRTPPRDPGAFGGIVAVDVMRAVPRLAPDQSLTSAATLMKSLGVRELPVVARGRLVGLLAESDLRPHDGHYEWTTVETAMTREPVTITAETPVAAIASLLLARSFNAVPVVVGGVPLGVVTRADLLRLVAGRRDG